MVQFHLLPCSAILFLLFERFGKFYKGKNSQKLSLLIFRGGDPYLCTFSLPFPPITGKQFIINNKKKAILTSFYPTPLHPLFGQWRRKEFINKGDVKSSVIKKILS